MSKIIISKISFLILVVSFNAFASYEARQAGMSEERLQKIGPSLSKYVTQGRLPGLITAVARKGKIVHFETQGFADVENKIPLKEDSLFRIYSMSKPVTGVALMILLEEGKIRLTDPVSWYIPEFAKTEVMIMNEDGSFSTEKLKRKMTIRDLATHTSGIAYSFTANEALQEIYEKEFNIKLKIKLKNDYKKNSFVNNLLNNNGVIKFNSKLSKISKYRFSKISKFDYYQPELLITDKNTGEQK